MADYETILANQQAQQAQEAAEKARQEAQDEQEEMVRQAAKKATKQPEFTDSDALIAPDDLGFLRVK